MLRCSPLFASSATIVLVFTVLASAMAQPPNSSPNLLIVLADDMGYGDLGVTGSQFIKTPKIDALAASGVFCTRAYVASPVCSPSRAGLLTGRDPRRFGYQDNLNSAARTYSTRPELLGLPITEKTLARQLQACGYATALVGKWHLGMGEWHHPNNRGFEYFCGMLGGWHDYFPGASKHQLQRNGVPLTEFSSDYLTDFFTDEAVRWIADLNRRDADKPWFLYLSYNAPHSPMQATKDDLAACQHIANSKRRTYAAMMRALDRGVGRVMKLLTQTGEREETLIVFLSDNGGATNNASWNGLLSGAKGSLREGGIRVPMIWSWPGRLPADTKYDQVVSSLDILPTFLAAAGIQPPPLAAPAMHEHAENRRRIVARYGPYDGVNLFEAFKTPDVARAQSLFWRLQGQAGVLHGDTKLVRLSHRPAQLFDTLHDVGEQEDLVRRDSRLAAQLFEELGAWEASLPTVPLWGSSPHWAGHSAQTYDEWQPRAEPR